MLHNPIKKHSYESDEYITQQFRKKGEIVHISVLVCFTLPAGNLRKVKES